MHCSNQDPVTKSISKSINQLLINQFNIHFLWLPWEIFFGVIADD